ncbi:uncharacterized protein At5g48480 [Mercurialis annua]|uniref:uncharacterized protein At5g48480 n=1 Tax=Mercurialis annua TaxID=3986 RepID=UPI00215E3A32|nr:uncharacterized protein At5g48480 [Mercurialis annua]
MAHQEGQNGDSDTAAAAVVYTAVKPQLLVEAPKANDAVQFYKAAFGATETRRTTQPKRKADQELPHIISAQLLLAGVSIFVSDISDDSAPEKNVAGTGGISLVLVTEDVEAAVSKAVAAGAVKEGETLEGEGAYYGGAERVAKLKDPYGYVWVISSPPKVESDDAEVAA